MERLQPFIFLLRKDMIGEIFLGFGIISRTIKRCPEFDIGMSVVKDYCKLGIGIYILKFMADHCDKID